MTAIGRPAGDDERLVAAGRRGDDGLVAAVRRGDDRAFEALYARYHQRIAAYVLARVKDHGRAEDITQEVFVSALRGMRGNHHPIALEPWLYRIARNACIDQYHRAQRAEEVVFDGTVGGSAPPPDSALMAKQDMHHLWGAFGGLSDTGYEVLVLREFEGLSYAEIGARLGMNRGAVETSLLRARRRLAEEFDELATGKRCRLTQELIPLAAADGLGRRDLHRVARHVAHCQPCRREALAAGVDSSLLTSVPLHRRVARKVAALLPFPLRGREEVAATLAGPAPQLAEPFHAGWAKAAAVVAVLVAGAGGAGTKLASDAGRQPATPVAVAENDTTSDGPGAGGSGAPAGADEAVRGGDGSGGEEGRGGGDGGRGDGGRGENGRDEGGRGEAGRGDEGRGDDLPRDDVVAGGDGGSTGGEGAQGGGDDRAGGGDGRASGDGGGGKDGGTNGGGGNDGGGGGGSDSPPTAEVPTRSGGGPVIDGVTKTVAGTVDGVGQTVGGAADGLGQTLDGVNQTLQGAPDGLNATVGGVNETVQQVTGGLGQTVEGVTQGLNDTLGGVGGLLRPKNP